MSVKKTLVNSIWFGVIPKLSTLINVILLPIITPYLSSVDFGIWGIISGYVGIFSSVASLGLYVHLTNSFYEYGSRYHYVWSRLLYLILLASSLCAFVLFITLLGSLDVIPLNKRPFVAFISVFPVLLCGNQLLAQHLYPLLGNPKPLVLRNLSASLLGIATTFILIYIFRLGYLGFVCGAAVNVLTAFSLFIYPLWVRKRIHPVILKSKKRILSLINVSYPAIPHALGFIFLSSSARIIMNFYNVPISDIGLYTNGYTIGDYITIITTATITSLAPQSQVSYRSKNFSKYLSLYYFCQYVSLTAILAFVIWMPQLYDILIHNDELKKGMEISQYSCFSNAIFSFYSFMAAPCFIEKRTKQLLWLVFVPGVLNVVLCLVLIPIFGYKVAIVTTIISYWSQLLIPFFVKYFRARTKEWFGNLNKIFVLFLILIASLYLSTYLSAMQIVYKVMITVLLLAISCIYFKYCARNQIV